MPSFASTYQRMAYPSGHPHVRQIKLPPKVIRSGFDNRRNAKYREWSGGWVRGVWRDGCREHFIGGEWTRI